MNEEIKKEFRDAIRSYENARHEAETNPLGRGVRSVRASGEGLVLFYEGRISGLSVALLKLGISNEDIDKIQREVTDEAIEELRKSEEREEKR